MLPAPRQNVVLHPFLNVKTALIFGIFKHTRSTGHKAILKNLSDAVLEVFSLSGFLPLFTLEK